MGIKRKGIFAKLLMAIICVSSVYAQNLIKNPSFEEFVNCPQRLGNFDFDVKVWSTPTEGSTDYFNACSTAMGTPENFNGRQPADFGVGYAGLYLYAPNDYREYLQAELVRPLEKDKEYQVSFFVSLAERSDYAVKEFGVLFAKDKLEISITKELSKKWLYQQKDNAYNYMEIGYTNFYSDTKDWVLVSTHFTAKGEERFMILGNFKSNARTRLFKTKYSAKKGAYYYVDMISVKSVETEGEAERYNDTFETREPAFELDKTHVFEAVLFSFDNAQLLEAAKKELHDIYSYLSNNDKLEITINGHTDATGSKNYNAILSSRRAEAVAQFLLSMGLPKHRVTWQGFGRERPIASNSTDEGRKQNRRVEFVISEFSSKE